MGDDPTHELPEGIDWRQFTPEDSPKTPPDLFTDPDFRDLATADVAPGGPAFDIDLPLQDFRSGSGSETGERFQLLVRAAERPVALIFGSYT